VIPPRPGRRVAVVVAPLAALAVAWTSHQVVLGTTSAEVRAGSAEAGAPTPEKPVSLPGVEDAIEAPASLSDAVRGGATTGGAGGLAEVAATSTAAPGDIPAVALSAYQRAESIINAADEACGISWQLVAAIGSVESDHGRYGGSTLDDEGRATPPILGPVLDGGPGMATIRDTDGGQYDGDQAYDRAVGPLQFIPSTWAIAGVDADDDGRRDPQDIDDAALAAAVYLCSGPEDLSTRAGQEAAVHRYNHSDAYVDLVLSRAQAYLDGDVVGGGSGSVVNAGSLTPLTPLAPASSVVRPARERGGAAGVAARAYRDAVSAYGLRIPGVDAAELVSSDEPQDTATAVPVRVGRPARPGAGAPTSPKPGDAPVDAPVDAGVPVDADAPADVPSPSDPPADSAVPAPGKAPAPEAPPVPAPTPEELAAAADATCTEQGLVDDETLVADDHDICVADELGLPTPVEPDAATDPSPASTEPDA